MSVSEILSALADQNRRNILLKLKEGKINSGDLAAALGMTPSALSYHLAKLKKADLIYETRYKNFIYYELDLTVLDEAIVWLDQLRGGEKDENENNKNSLFCSHVPAPGRDGDRPVLSAGPDTGPLQRRQPG